MHLPILLLEWVGQGRPDLPSSRRWQLTSIQPVSRVDTWWWGRSATRCDGVRTLYNISVPAMGWPMGHGRQVIGWNRWEPLHSVRMFGTEKCWASVCKSLMTGRWWGVVVSRWPAVVVCFGHLDLDHSIFIVVNFFIFAFTGCDFLFSIRLLHVNRRDYVPST